MARSVSLLVCLALSACAGAMPETNRAEGCDVPRTNAWLRAPAPMDWTGIELVDVLPVLVVSHDMQAALSQLSVDEAVQITPAQVQRFTGGPAQANPAGTNAYLIRAVFPTPRPGVKVGWYRDDLHVFAGGLGCAPYERRAVIVYLDRSPREVYVSAMSAM